MDTKHFHKFLSRERDHQYEMDRLSLAMPPLLKRARAELGLSLRDMAKRIGFSPTFLSMVETGQRPATSLLIASVVEVMEAKK